MLRAERIFLDGNQSARGNDGGDLTAIIKAQARLFARPLGGFAEQTAKDAAAGGHAVAIDDDLARQVEIALGIEGRALERIPARLLHIENELVAHFLGPRITNPGIHGAERGPALGDADLGIAVPPRPGPGGKRSGRDIGEGGNSRDNQGGSAQKQL